MVYEKADWDYKTFQLDSGLKVAEQKTGDALDAINADLRPFKARGGKLILYHGWDDPAISSLNTIHYYNSVIEKMGQREVDSFVRLYMAPGVQHCEGGPGPDSYGEVGDLNSGDPRHSLDGALEHWVEKGTAPQAIIASKFSGEDRQHATMMRPLCPYPKSAKYKGEGDTNDAANFSCEEKKK
jgi:hypothetical protein